MAVEDAERRRLGLEALNHPGEHDVLQDVGMISGVKGVAVVHAAILRDLCRTAQGLELISATRSD